jgi:CRISPR/Cas system-associated protein Cas5 (RAMP superfamily)
MKINFEYYFKLYYYRYFNPHIVNHYNLINKLNTYKSIGLSYYKKYPGASNWGNLNEKLFEEKPQAKQEFCYCLEQQEQIKKQILLDIKFLSKKNKNYKICSDYFQSFYVEYDYHIEQNIDSVINYLKEDIIVNELNTYT